MTSTPPNGSPLPGNNPNPRGRSTVSFRTHTGPNQSPHFNTSPNFGSSYFPPATESPTRSHAADERHRAQLATYKRDPNKVAAANRLSVLDNLWGGVGRRLSLIIEDGPSDGKDEKRRARVWFNFRIYLRQWKIRRYLFYFFGLFAIYYFLLRPMLSVAPSSSVSLGSSSAGTKVTTSKKPAKTTSHLAVDSNSTVAPLKARSKIPNRAPLPPGVIFRSLPDHPKERGLLKVDPESQVHPIYQLIRDGREAWDRKVAKQSQTLKEAVAEYKRRYQRLPPKGFDKWWEYVRYVDPSSSPTLPFLRFPLDRQIVEMELTRRLAAQITSSSLTSMTRSTATSNRSTRFPHVTFRNESRPLRSAPTPILSRSVTALFAPVRATTTRSTAQTNACPDRPNSLRLSRSTWVT